ncbi:MAG: hypothetical protein Q8P50_06365, partial [Bacillota bacterium]|nr:hypothetical protein [Bacillota bacterium]
MVVGFAALLLVVFGLLFVRNRFLSWPLMLALVWFVPISSNAIPMLYGLSSTEMLALGGLLYVILFRTRRTQKILHYQVFLLLGGAVATGGVLVLALVGQDMNFGSLYLRNALITPLMITALLVNTLDSRRRVSLATKYFFAGTVVFSAILLANFALGTFTYTGTEKMEAVELYLRLGGIPTFPLRVFPYYSPVPLGTVFSTLFMFFLPLSVKRSLGQGRLWPLASLIPLVGLIFL